MKTRVAVGLPLLFIVLFSQCHDKPKTLFTLMSGADTGIDFANTITEDDQFNILTEEYIYNGGGVGIGDFNNDSLPDIFFAGNMVANKLYLNQGDFSFKDVSEEAGVGKKGIWSSGVSVVDINQDGWMDIYVCATMRKDSALRRNMLFINKGISKDGVPEFEDKAFDYHLDENGFSTNASFFDYDHDGDLDVYVLTDNFFESSPFAYRTKILDGSSPTNHQFFRNDGDGTFTNVTKEAGIVIEGFGLGVAVSDINQDGWPDIYVSNDYVSNDVLYINNKNGTFTNRITEFIGHTSHFSMGNDIADINNDGLPDIITLDMLPETNVRKKTMFNTKSYTTYINNEKWHYEYQYMRNMLQLNNGMSHGTRFSEIGQLAGVFQTEWSWTPLLADFDNDGFRDLLVTNGYPRDVTDKDFANFRRHARQNATTRQIMDAIPVVKIPNYAFHNNGDLTFKDVTKEWGMDAPSFSNGAAFADLDNDGDLDYVVSNVNGPAFVYRNNLNAPGKNPEASAAYLRIKLGYQGKNAQGIGTKVTLRYQGKVQYQELSISRGYLSSVEDVLHFGLGKVSHVDTLMVQWPDGSTNLLTNVKANQLLKLQYRAGQRENENPVSILQKPLPKPLFRPAAKEHQILFRHSEEDRYDFNLQRTLPHKFSQAGPGLATGDVNGDGLEDFIVGGSAGNNETIFFQQADGSFRQKEIANKNKIEEDTGLLLFDADDDGDLDLYAVSGSYENVDTEDAYLDRLYLNNGKGDFSRSTDRLPAMYASKSCVRAADFDRDGDLDLFVGGRVVVGGYPLTPESYLLRNDHGKFTEVTNEICPELKRAGMITDALWTDFDADGKADLMVVGEFMPIVFFRNDGTKLARVAAEELNSNSGMWNSISAGDFDKDGDTDYVVGNLGLNNNYQASAKYPVRVYGKDFDKNNSVDPIMVTFVRDSMGTDERKPFVMHFWDEINSQSPLFRRKFKSYHAFGKATIGDFFTKKELEDAVILEATQLASVYLENTGDGKFKVSVLPTLAQVAPVNGMVADDFNGDGNLDVLMVGNDYGNEVFAGRYDAFTGLVLLGDGGGSFQPMLPYKSGFSVPGDAKALAAVTGPQQTLYIATQNRDSLKVFAQPRRNSGVELRPKADEISATLKYPNGKTERIEFYYGSGYLSQSTRRVTIPSGVTDCVIRNAKGAERKWSSGSQ